VSAHSTSLAGKRGGEEVEHFRGDFEGAVC
jgi:hypothetical protein